MLLWTTREQEKAYVAVGGGVHHRGVDLAPYRLVLAIPGVTRLTLLAMAARVPAVSVGIVVTLHVVLGLGLGYGPAGIVGAAATIGTAVGAPVLGRVVDLYGLRKMLVGTTLVQGVYWSSAPWLSYPALLVTSLVGGFFMVPVFSVVRQALAAMVPVEQRRAAYSLDSMSIELSFMVGPVVAVLIATQVSTAAAMLTLGALVVCSGVLLYVLNPPVRSDAAHGAGRPPVRTWLRPGLVAALMATAATTVVLAGTDVAVVAALQSAGQVGWVGLVLAMWGLYSLIGGFVYGALSRSVQATTLAVALGLFTIPVGLFGNRWWALSIALIPAGALCAPTLAALANDVSRLAPETVRGLVMGLQSSAITAGFAAGAPLGGAVTDASAPAWAFAVTGAAGTMLAVAAIVVRRLDGSSVELAEPTVLADPVPAP